MSSSTFAHAVGKRRNNDRLYAGIGENNNSQQYKQTEENFSFGSLFSEIKSIFSNLNVQKIVAKVRNMLFRLKECDDAISKITCIVESIFEIFD